MAPPGVSCGRTPRRSGSLASEHGDAGAPAPPPTSTPHELPRVEAFLRERSPHRRMECGRPVLPTVRRANRAGRHSGQHDPARRPRGGAWLVVRGPARETAGRARVRGAASDPRPQEHPRDCATDVSDRLAGHSDDRVRLSAESMTRALGAGRGPFAARRCRSAAPACPRRIASASCFRISWKNSTRPSAGRELAGVHACR